MSTPSLFKWRHFLLLCHPAECARSIAAMRSRTRDLEEMMRERGIEVDHSTLNRWVLKYALLSR